MLPLGRLSIGDPSVYTDRNSTAVDSHIESHSKNASKGVRSTLSSERIDSAGSGSSDCWAHSARLYTWQLSDHVELAGVLQQKASRLHSSLLVIGRSRLRRVVVRRIVNMNALISGHPCRTVNLHGIKLQLV